jgi:hypothetical protein
MSADGVRPAGITRAKPDQRFQLIGIELDARREVKTLQAAFALDVRDVAWTYLRENTTAVTAEMRRLARRPGSARRWPPMALPSRRRRPKEPSSSSSPPNSEPRRALSVC